MAAGMTREGNTHKHVLTLRMPWVEERDLRAYAYKWRRCYLQSSRKQQNLPLSKFYFL